MAAITQILGRGVEILQNGYVVDDLEQAMAQWLALGVGPFVRLDVDIEGADYRGTSQPMRARFGLAQAGGIQIELIEPVGDHPCAYRDTVKAGHSALHHVLMIARDYDADMAALRKAGFAVATEADLGGQRFAYVDTSATIGCMLELVEDSPTIRSINAAVTAAALDWDGSDPIRPYDLGG